MNTLLLIVLIIVAVILFLLFVPIKLKIVFTDSFDFEIRILGLRVFRAMAKKKKTSLKSQGINLILK